MTISLNPSTLLSGQGIDVSSLVQQVLTESSGQLTEWQSEQTTLQNQAANIVGINSDLTKLAAAVQALSDPLGALTAVAANSSDANVLTATATTSASSGTHQIVVKSLATTGVVYTQAFAGGDSTSILSQDANTGEIDLQVGGDAGTTRQISISRGSNDTLSSLADYINQQGWGVTASVVPDADGSHLAIVSQAAGAAGALSITSNDTGVQFVDPSGGTNASVTIDGVPRSYASNTITGAIPGVTLNLSSASPGETVQLSVGPDATQVMSALNNFVSAYNQVINDINQQFTVNPATDSEGPLGSDSGLRALQSSLMNDVTYAISGNGGLVNLAALGINMNNDGTLAMGVTPDGKTTSQVMAANPGAFQAFFQNVGGTGFANKFNQDLMNLTDPTVGVLNVDLAQNKTQQQNLADSINNFENQLNDKQKALMLQFSQVNASLQQYPLLLQQVTDTLGTLNASSGNSKSGS